MGKQLTTEDFITRAHNIHGDIYDYSNTTYINSRTKLDIKCKTHGTFTQLANHHLRGNGCPTCVIDRKRKSQNDTIKQFKTKHNNTYDYTHVEYVNNNTKVKILCRIHGIFEQTPKQHIRYGCNECAKEYRAQTLRKGTQQFIKESLAIHGNIYDYSQVEYIHNKSHVNIICHIHGVFQQYPQSHLRGHICPSCKQKSIGETQIQNVLDDHNISYASEYVFSDCKYYKSLRYDFYCHDLNLCIEYDGIQHFKPIEFFGGEKSFQSQKYKDKIKTEYCTEHDIHLLRIPYTSINNTQEILSNKITELEESL